MFWGVVNVVFVMVVFCVFSLFAKHHFTNNVNIKTKAPWH